MADFVYEEEVNNLSDIEIDSKEVFNSKSKMIGTDDNNKKQGRRIKQRLFKTINLMTEYNTISNWVYCMLLWIELLEFLGFLFYKFNVSNLFKYDDQGHPLVYFTPYYWVGYLNSQTIYLEYGSAILSYVSSLAIIVPLTVSFVFLFIISKQCDDGYKTHFTKPSHKFLIKSCNIAQVLLLKIFMIPVLMILLSPMICSNKDNALKESYNYYYSYQCWTPYHFVLSLVGLAYSLIIIVILCVQSLLYNDPRSAAKVPWGCSQSKAELVKTLIKINMVMCLILSIYATYIKIIFKVTNMLLALCLVYQRYYFFYHSNKQIYIITVLQESSYLWLSFVVSIINFIKTDLSIFAFVYIIVTLIVFDLMMMFIFISKMSVFSLLDFPSIKDEPQFEQYFLRLKQYFTQNDASSINKTVILGLVKSHFKDCKTLNCQCQILLYTLSQNKLRAHFDDMLDSVKIHPMKGDEWSDNEDDNQASQQYVSELNKWKTDPNKNKGSIQDQFKIMLFQFYYQLLGKAANVLPKSIRIKFLQQTLLQGELNNEFKSYFQIIKLLKQKPSLEWEYYLYQSKQNVEQIMYKKYQQLLNNKQSIDCIKMYDFEQLFIIFEKQIINTANNCLSFWKELMDKRLDVNRIHDFGVQISNSYSNVNIISKRMLSLYPNHLLLLKIYSFFLSDVMNNEQEALEYSSKARGFIQNQNNIMKNSKDEDKFFGYNTKTVIITMTVTTKDIGRIVNTNFEVKRLLGYQNKEIKGRNVRILMPKNLSENHDNFINNYFETAKAKILEQQRIVFAKNKEGYIIPVYILVKAIPNLQRSLTFIGFLRRLDDNHPFLQPPSQFAGAEYHIMMADTEGQIFGFTENCWETFGFRPNFFFNRFGDPEQMIRMEKIIKYLKEPQFLLKVEQKKEGQFCSLDTAQVMENISKELLTREEQDVLLNISGSYNVNLQIDDMTFYNGKIAVKIYKILKLSRIIRSQNVFDMIQIKVDEFNDSSGDSSQDDQEHAISSPNTKIKQRQDSIDFEDDIYMKSSSLGVSERSEEPMSFGSTSSSTMQGSKYIQSFKKTISTTEMPSSIKKLNKVVYILVCLIIIISIFDLIQTLTFYNFTSEQLYNVQLLYQKQNLLGLIGTNLVTIAMIQQGVQQNTYSNITNRFAMLNESLAIDIEAIQSIEKQLQDISKNSFIYSLMDFTTNPYINLLLINEEGSISTQNQSMMFSMYQYTSNLQTLIYSNDLSQNNLINNIYSIGNSSNLNKSLLTDSQKSIYFVVQNSMFELNQKNIDITLDFIDAFNFIISTNTYVLICVYAFFVIFVFISGLIVFPIVIGVQKNKVMILSIYFELPPSEIARVYAKCFHFVRKIDIKFHGTPIVSEIQNVQQNTKSPQDIENNEEQSEDSSVSTNRQLQMSQRQQMLRRKSAFHGRSHRHILEVANQEQAKQTTKQAKSIKRKKYEVEIEEKEDQEEQNDADASSYELNKQSIKEQEMPDKIDVKKMFKDIKVKNHSVNLITFLMIMCFLAYFSFSFGINKEYVKNISTMLDTTTTLYDGNPNLQNAYFFFIQDIMRNTILTGNISQDEEPPALNIDMYDYYFQNIYTNMNNMQSLKINGDKGELQGDAFTFINEVDSDMFCSIIQSSIDSEGIDTSGLSCSTFDNSEFTYGQKQVTSNFLYSLQNLYNSFEKQRKNSTYLASLLNDQDILSFSVKSNIYYRASYIALLNNTQSSIDRFYFKVNLMIKIKFSVFIVFTFIIFNILWRIFLQNIQAEVFRSKGMLNMIPTEFLERDNNIKKLALNKLVNVN